jgi:hypothetical protein
MSHHHIHGGPIWGKVSIGEGKSMTCLQVLYRNSRAMVSFARPDQLKTILKTVGAKVVLDNGAFSVWKKAKKQQDVVDWGKYWTAYYLFVMTYISSIDWFIVPDVIEGNEKENQDLIDSIPSSLRHKAVPVWHSDESIDKLIKLCLEFKIVAIGCCGESGVIRSKEWSSKMNKAFSAIYIERQLTVKIHGLRMLDGRAMIQYPFDSCDSTNVAINVPKDKARYPEVKCKLARTAILKGAIEQVKPPSIQEWVSNFRGEVQLQLF